MKNVSSSTDKPHLVMSLVKGITIDPVVSESEEKAVTLSSLSLQDMNKSPMSRSNATQTINPGMQQKGIQSTPILNNKATDSNDLIRLAHKLSMTQATEKRDQNVHTVDLIKVNQIGTNTAQLPIPSTRTTACNTISADKRTVGINCIIQSEVVESSPANSNVASKIPRPNSVEHRKFVRQETFTLPSPSQECPAEKLLK